MPCRASPIRKLSRQLCIERVWWPKRHVFDSALHAPPTVSCRPHVSATIVASASPSMLISVRAGREEEVALRADRVGRAVAVLVVVRVVTERVDGLRALEVDDPQPLPGGDHARPRFAGQLHVVVHGARPGRGAIRGASRRHLRPVVVGVLEAAPRFVGERAARVVGIGRSAAAAPRTRSGPGSYAGFGSSTCGVAEIATSTRISARSSIAAPGRAGARVPLQRALGRDAHARERVEAHHEVAAPEPVAAERHHEVVARVAVELVVQVAVRARSVPTRASSAASPKPASASWWPLVSSTIENSTRPRSENSTRPVVEEDLVLDLDGVGRVEPFARLVGVVREQRARLPAVDVDDPQALPAVEDARPVPARGDGLFSQHGCSAAGVMASSFGTTPARASPRGRQTSRAFLPPCNSAHGHAARSLSVLTRTRCDAEPRRRNPRDRNCRPRR